MNIAGIILAAGESSRMGRDKALLPYLDTTFLNHIIRLLAPRVIPVIVVLGHNAEAIRESVPRRQNVEVVVNEQYKSGMLSSLQAGVRSLAEDVKAAMFTLVDHPAVRGRTLDRLLAEFEHSGSPLVIPRVGERRGHPVVAARGVLNELLELPPEASPKDVIRAHRDETRFLDVEDPGVLKDIDRPEDYEALGVG